MTPNLTVGRDNADMASLGRHVSDGEPRVVPQVVTLDATERITRRPSPSNAEQHTYDEMILILFNNISFYTIISDHCGHSEVHYSIKHLQIIKLMKIINENRPSIYQIYMISNAGLQQH